MLDTTRSIIELMRWHRPVGTLLLLFPTLCALVLASKGLPTLDLTLIFIVGCFCMRSAGCVVNDIFDREFDAQVERTKNRPLASNRLTVPTAWLIFAILTSVSAGLLFFVNMQTRWLALLGLILAVCYPLAKRITYFPQVVLGVAFSWGILLASTAAQGKITIPIWILFAASFFWIIAYDTIYAMMDQADDQRIGIKSSALWIGDRIQLLQGVLFSVVWLLLAWLGLWLELGIAYFGIVSCIGVAFVLQARLPHGTKRNTLQRWFNANQWLWLALLVGLIIGHLE